MVTFKVYCKKAATPRKSSDDLKKEMERKRQEENLKRNMEQW